MILSGIIINIGIEDMKILLIQPKMSMRPMDTILKTRMAPSLGLYTLVALTPKEYEIVVVNENIEAIDYAEKFDLVAITVTVDVYPRAIEIAKIFRTKEVPVVAGGIHISACPDDAMNHFDAIMIGMAERIWTKLLLDCKNKCLKNVILIWKIFQVKKLFPLRMKKLIRINIFIRIL